MTDLTERPRTVYFIKPIGMQGPVKIGCSISPTGRRSTLQSWSPLPLEIAAEIAGDFGLERKFHEKFIGQHRGFEWFDWSPELQDTIDAIGAGAFDIATLPEVVGCPVFRGKGKGRRWSEEQRRQYTYSRRVTRTLHETGYSFPRDSYHIISHDLTGLADAYLAEPHVHGIAIDAPWARAKQREWLAKVQAESAAA